LFLSYWDKVYVPSFRAHQDTKSASDDGMKGMFMGTNQVAGAKLVMKRLGEENTPAALGKRRLEKRTIMALITAPSNLLSTY
jgi:hypothetical protein